MRMPAVRLGAVVVLFVGVAACGTKHTGGGDDQSDGLVSIDVLPANATVTYTGSPVTLAYTALGHYDDGHTAPLATAAFGLDDTAALLGTLDATATFTATGTGAGKGQISATLGEIHGATSVIVQMHTTTFGAGVDPGAGSNFTDPLPTGALSPVVDYPLAGAVMPSSVKAPDVMWEPGASVATDLYRVRWTAGLATQDTILVVASGFKFDAKPADRDWQALLNSAQGEPITVEVAHWDAATGAQVSPAVAVNVVTADVVGAIYYWDLSQGRMKRIDADGLADAIPNPPGSPNAADAGAQCVACHAISHDGRYLSASLFGGGEQGGVFDLSNPDVTSGAVVAPTLAPVTATSYRTLFSTFSPDDTRLVINNGVGLDLLDPQTGTSVVQNGTPLPTAGMAHPSWSPDGSAIAVVGNHNGSWAVDYTVGDLQIIPVTGPDTFGPATTIVAAASVDPAFAAPSWPSFSPDSRVVAYGAGVNSRGRNSDGTTEITYPGALFYVPKAGGAPVLLDGACSSGRNCFLPNFSPFDDGGYFWMVFYSLRDYGNAQAGTRGTTRRQMWITAIDKTKLAAGVDASSVPYWLPEQDVATENMSAFWSVAPPIQ